MQSHATVNPFVENNLNKCNVYTKRNSVDYSKGLFILYSSLTKFLGDSSPAKWEQIEGLCLISDSDL